MANKVIEAADAFNKAEVAFNEVFESCSFYSTVNGKSVQVFGEHDLDLVPGEVQCEPWNCPEYPQYRFRLYKMCNGIQFFYLVGDRPMEAS